MRKIPAFAGAALVCAALGCSTSSAVAEAKAPATAEAKGPVTLGEVSASGATTFPDAAKILRHDVEAELGAIDWSRSTRAKGKRLTMSAALVRLDSVKTGDHGLRANCTVSATLLDEHGALVATLQGRADAEDDGRDGRGAERDALKVAVKGAVAHVPEALDRLP
jgi:hypothetical protein